MVSICLLLTTVICIIPLIGMVILACCARNQVMHILFGLLTMFVGFIAVFVPLWIIGSVAIIFNVGAVSLSSLVGSSYYGVPIIVGCTVVVCVFVSYLAFVFYQLGKSIAEEIAKLNN